MTTRCKFRLQSITHNAGFTGQILKFTAIQSTEVPEDKGFTKYTPNGELNVTIDNPAVLSGMKIGELYYLDLTLIEPSAKT